MNKLLTSLIIFCAVFSLEAQSLYFPPTIGNQWETIPPADLGWCPERIDSLYEMLEEENTHAFILLKDGKIVLEKYFAPFGQDSIWYWASAGKSLTAFLIGIAQEQGHLSIEDSTYQYLGSDWTSCSDSDEQKITIRHQLTMTTGLDDGVDDPYCTIDTCLVCLAAPGTRWAYHNAPYTLLDGVIDMATNQSLNGFMFSQVSLQTGINGLFVRLDDNNVFFSKARSMARFGLLVLNEGSWGNLPILNDSNYFNQMVNTSQNLNEGYGYLWWLNGKETFMLPGLQNVFSGSLMPNAPDDMIAALGKNGQYINVVPSQGLVLIRMGDAPSSVEVPVILNDKIWEYINVFDCTTATTELNLQEDLCSIYPNPSAGDFAIRLLGYSFNLTLYNSLGEIVFNQSDCSDTEQIKTSLLPGIYFMHVQTKEGAFVKKVSVFD